MKSKKEINIEYKKLEAEKKAKKEIKETDWKKLKKLSWFLDERIERLERQEQFLDSDNELVLEISKMSNDLWKQINKIDKIK